MDLVKALCLCVLAGLIVKSTFGYVRVCYYTNWSQFDPAPHDLTPRRIPANLCTHIVFAFADIRDANVIPTEFNDVQMYARLNRLRRRNPSLHLLLAVGGWAAGGSTFSSLVSNQNEMIQFAKNLVTYLRRYSFDGANIDWQYPTVEDRGSDVIDRQRFTKFLEIIRFAFDEEELKNKTSVATSTRLSLSVNVEANITEARTFYETRRIGQFVDWAFLMAYDFHGYWDLNSGALHHSALYPDISSFVRGWLDDGLPAPKIVLGISGFGRSFTLASAPTGSGLGQAVVSGGVAGNISTTEPDLLEYGEICRNVREFGWRRVWVRNQSVPIAFGNTTSSGGSGGSNDGWQWVGYDDPRSLREKSRFIRQNGLAGVMFWSLSRDDFTNVCGQGAWPLMGTLARELPINDNDDDDDDDDDNNRNRSKSSSPSSSSPASSQNTTRTSTINEPSTNTNTNTTTIPASLFPPHNKPRNKNKPTNSTTTTTTTTTTLSSNPDGDTIVKGEKEKDEEKEEEEKHDTFTTASSKNVFNEFDFSSLDGIIIPRSNVKAKVKVESASPNTDDPQVHTPSKQQQQCKISSNAGPTLTCPPTKGKPGDRNSFYLFCAPGFLAIECQCPPGHFYNRCLSVCDRNHNFHTCPIAH